MWNLKECLRIGRKELHQVIIFSNNDVNIWFVADFFFKYLESTLKVRLEKNSSTHSALFIASPRMWARVGAETTTVSRAEHLLA